MAVGPANLNPKGVSIEGIRELLWSLMAIKVSRRPEDFLSKSYANLRENIVQNIEFG
jgi:hypothetical protein